LEEKKRGDAPLTSYSPPPLKFLAAVIGKKKRERSFGPLACLIISLVISGPLEFIVAHRFRKGKKKKRLAEALADM